MSDIMIVGGAGFIGSNLIQGLSGKPVTVYDNLSTGSLHNLPEGTRVIEGDIRDTDTLEHAMRGVRSVVHLAAFGSVIDSITDPIANFDVNARGTLNVLEACRKNGVERMIFASTGGALIGNATPPVDEMSLPRPISPYGAGKLCGEAYCHTYAKAFGLHTVALRFANVYGPLSLHKKGAITAFMKCLLRDEPIQIYGPGTASRDYLFTGDLCSGILAALTADVAPGEVFHLASGVETSVRELAELICEVAGRPDHPIEHKPARTGEVERNFARYDKAHAALGFSPGIPLHDGIQRTWEWYRMHRDEIRSETANPAST